MAIPGGYIRSANGLGAVLREKNSSSSKALATIPDGETVEIIEVLDRRSKVQYDNLIGFVLNDLIDYGTPENSTPVGDQTENNEAVVICLSRRTALELYDACAASLGLGVG
ncbi:MAG: SH3 domain-containing protein [Clostridia bacterium]|nr:SH3 domain-containing protein [Clostridia bacterium]